LRLLGVDVDLGVDADLVVADLDGDSGADRFGGAF
jgi:hypothetical protein